MNIHSLNKSFNSYQVAKKTGEKIQQGAAQNKTMGKQEDVILLHHKVDPNLVIRNLQETVLSDIVGTQSDKISMLKEQVSNGTYFVDSNTLAKSMLEEMIG